MRLLHNIHHLDVFIFMRLLNAPLHLPLRKVSKIFSMTGDGPLYAALILIFAWQQGFDHPFLKLASGAFLIERSVYYMLKNSLRRNRPQAALANFTSFIVPSDQFSFPSGHTSAAFLMATLCAAVWPSFSLLFYAWAGAIGISRVFLGVHFPTDIMVGAMLGITIAHLSIQWV